MFIKNNGEDLIEDIYTLETLLKFSWNYCNDKELSLDYYNLTGNDKYLLSNERYDYLNIFKLALEKVERIKDDAIPILEKYSDNCCR